MTSSKFKSPKRNLWKGMLNRQRLFIFSLGVFVIAGLFTCLNIRPKYEAKVLFKLPSALRKNENFSEYEIIKKTKNQELIFSALNDVIYLGEISQTPQEKLEKQKHYCHMIKKTAVVSREIITKDFTTYSLKILSDNPQVLKQAPELLLKKIIDESFKEFGQKAEADIIDISNKIKIASLEIAKLAPEKLKKETKKDIKIKVSNNEKIKNKIAELKLKLKSFDDKISRDLKEKVEFEKRLEKLKNKIAKPSSSEETTRIVYGPNPKRKEIEKYILDWKAEITRAKNEEKMTESHPHIKGLRDQIAKFENDLQELPEQIEIKRIVSPESDFKNLNSKIDETKKRISLLETELVRCKSLQTKVRIEIKKLSEMLAKLPAKEKELTINTPLSNDKKSKAEQARVAKVEALIKERNLSLEKRKKIKAEIAQFNLQKKEILKSVTFSNKFATHAKPRLAILLIVVFVAGIFFAFGVVLIVAVSDKTVTTPSQAGKATGFVVLGSVGEICTKKQKSRKTASWIITPIIGTIFVVAAGLLTIKLTNQLGKKIELTQADISQTLNIGQQAGDEK